MSEPTTVTYSIAEVLKRIEDKLDRMDEKFEGKIDTLQKEVTDLKVGQATLIEKVGGMDQRLSKVESEQATMVKAISDLQGFRSLILPIVVAVSTALLTLLFRLVPNLSP
jgi:chromosome segregation ATPase